MSPPQPSPVSRLARMQQILFALWVVVTVDFVAWACLGVWWAAWGTGICVFTYPATLGVQFALSIVCNAMMGTPGGERRFPMGAWLREIGYSVRVFSWWQPWCWRRYADALPPGRSVQGKTGVLLVHGYLCNRGFWLPWLTALDRLRWPVLAINLEPVFTGIDDHSLAIDRAVNQLIGITGRPPVVVAHSMGGLAVRAWLRNVPDGLYRVAHVVTIGTPHQGTWLAAMGWGISAAQMRWQSDWLTELAKTEPPGAGEKFTCWYSSQDNVVFPSVSAQMPGAAAHQLRGVGHVTLAYHPRVRGDVYRLIGLSSADKTTPSQELP